jgi:hypothetical protein
MLIMTVFFHFGANNEFMFKSQKYLNILSGQPAEDCRPLQRYREQEPNNKYRLPENAVLYIQFLLPGKNKKKPVHRDTGQKLQDYLSSFSSSP